MSKDTAVDSPGDVSSELRAAAKQLEPVLAHLRKLQGQISKAAKDSAAGRPMTALSKLSQELKKSAEMPTILSVAELVKKLDSHLDQHRQSGLEVFVRSLVDLAPREGLSAKVLSPERLAVGPFLLTPDYRKEDAELAYAKIPVARVRLDAGSVLKAARELAESLLTLDEDGAFAKRLDEALRVAAARSGKPSLGRAELPGVFQELRAMALMETRPRQYTLPQFVVALKAFVQSDANLQASRRYRLETAVLENAKDKAKSVFIPADTAAGYGEGTYFQAIVVENAA